MTETDPLALALTALGRRERSRSELAEWLAKRGVDAVELEATLASLEDLGELDDARFARRYAEDKRELRGWGPERIRATLASRGLAPEQIESALGAEGRDDQLQRAMDLLERRDDPPVDERSRSRALAYLARRGYDSELAYDAVRGLERSNAGR
jgi:regulatory protein